MTCSKVHQIDTHDELTILFGKVFLGINLSCISCHDGADHLEKVNVYLSQQKRSDFFQQAAFLGHTRYIPHVEQSEALMGHFIVDDLAPGYDTKADSMLRIERSGGPSQPEVHAHRRDRPARRRPARRTGTHVDEPSAVRPRHGQSVLVEADGLRHRRTGRRVRPCPPGSEARPAGWEAAALTSRIARRAGGGFPQEQLQSPLAVPHDLQLQRLPAFGALSRRVERALHASITRASTPAC